MANANLKVYYYDPGSVLVVNPKGKIRKLYTPFRVLCITTLTTWLTKGSWVFVDEVKTTKLDELIFVVGGKSFPHRHFLIQINF